MKGCMKKLNLVGILAFMILCFTGCGNNSDNSQSESSNAEVSKVVLKESGEEIMEKVKQKMIDRDKWKVNQVSTIPLGDNKPGLTSTLLFNYIKGNDNDEAFSIQVNRKDMDDNDEGTTSVIKENDYLYYTELSSDEEDCLKCKAKDDGSILKESLEKMEESYYNHDIKNWNVKVQDSNYVISGSCDNKGGRNLNITCNVDSDYNILSSDVKLNYKFSSGREMIIEKKSTFSYDDVNVPKVENSSDYEITDDIDIPFDNF